METASSWTGSLKNERMVERKIRLQTRNCHGKKPVEVVLALAKDAPRGPLFRDSLDPTDW